jgi:hypothetical protein
MRKISLLAAAIAIVLTLSLGFCYAQTPIQDYAQGGWYCPWHNQSMSQGYARQNTGGWYCPWMNGGYQQSRPRGMGYGTIGHAGCMGYGWGYRDGRPGSAHGSGYNNSATQSQTP